MLGVFGIARDLLTATLVDAERQCVAAINDGHAGTASGLHVLHTIDTLYRYCFRRLDMAWDGGHGTSPCHHEDEVPALPDNASDTPPISTTNLSEDELECLRLLRAYNAGPQQLQQLLGLTGAGASVNPPPLGPEDRSLEELFRKATTYQGQAPSHPLLASVRTLGMVLLNIARNEIRYWDSRRDWSHPHALQLLMTSSQKCCGVFGLLTSLVSDVTPAALSQPQGVASQDVLNYVSALTKYANSQFKCGCVVEGEAATPYYDRAEASLEEGRRSLRSFLNGGYIDLLLGELELVGGVTTTCRSRAAKNSGKEWKGLSRTAIVQFFRAEKLMKSSVGDINEKSMYTHGNLAECYLYDWMAIEESLFHSVEACKVAVGYFGCEHENTKRKLAEFAEVLPFLVIRKPSIWQFCPLGGPLSPQSLQAVVGRVLQGEGLEEFCVPGNPAFVRYMRGPYGYL
jgi:hypothetical protein